MPSVPSLMMLGLLEERPWTAYELVKHLSPPSMAGMLWDVSERTWYREPPRLVEAGLAEVVGGSEPPRYRITEAGRQALRESGLGATRHVHRNEILALIYAAGGTSVDELRRRLEALREGMLQLISGSASYYRELAERGAEVPGRAHVSALLADATSRAHLSLHSWAVDALDRLDVLGPDVDSDAVARELWVEIADRLEAYVADAG